MKKLLVHGDTNRAGKTIFLHLFRLNILHRTLPSQYGAKGSLKPGEGQEVSFRQCLQNLIDKYEQVQTV